MLEFDPNLIKYQKIFQVEEIQYLYFYFKQFNNYLPENWHQLDLFSFNEYGLAILLGIDKERFDEIKNAFKFTYYFLVERVNFNIKECNKMEIFTVPTFASNKKRIINGKEYLIADKDISSFLYTFNKVSSLKNEYIIEKDLTLNRFLRLFDLKMCQNAVLPIPYSLHLKERSK